MFLKSQFGRSMVEMLGVLAVVGVLSIGAMTGYRGVMNKRQLNEIKLYLEKVKMVYKAQVLTGMIKNIASNVISKVKNCTGSGS